MTIQEGGRISTSVIGGALGHFEARTELEGTGVLWDIYIGYLGSFIV